MLARLARMRTVMASMAAPSPGCPWLCLRPRHTCWGPLARGISYRCVPMQVRKMDRKSIRPGKANALFECVSAYRFMQLPSMA